VFDAKFLQDAAAPFWVQGSDQVFVTAHCGRLYVGTIAPKTCRVCGQAPEFVTMVKGQDPHEILAALEAIK